MNQRANCNSETVRRKGHGASTAHQRWRDRVAANVARQQRKRAKIEAEFRADKRRNQASHFRRTYDRTIDDPFPAPDKVNMERAAYLPKFELLHNAEGGLLSYPAVALYPVLCIHADYNDPKRWLQRSRENLADRAGLSTKTVDVGLDELLGATMPVKPGATARRPLLQREPGQSGCRQYWLYQLGFVRPKIEGDDWRYHCFPFHGQIVDSRTWARLSRRAKALYLIARSNSYFDPDLYGYTQGIDLDDAEVRDEFYRNHYSKHKWDVCTVPLARLCSMAGISRPHKPVLDELAAEGLIEELPLMNKRDRVLKVYRHSCNRRSYNRERNLRRALQRERRQEAVL